MACEHEIKEKKRYDEIDIVRGLGIIMVVMLHAGIGSMFWTNFFGSFHMALFIFCSGFCFDKKKNDFKVFQALGKKIRSLYLPYVLFNSAMILFNNIFVDINFYTDDPVFTNAEIGIANFYGLKPKITFKEALEQIFWVLLFGKNGEPQLGGATWFFRVLFIITILFYAINLLGSLKNRALDIVHIIAATCLLELGWVGHKSSWTNTYQILTCCSIYFIYVFGYFLRKSEIFKEFYDFGLSAVVFVVALSALLIATPDAAIGINANNYLDVPHLIVVSVMGCLVTFLIAIFISKLKIIRDVFILLGRNSLYIMLFHFMAFKLVTLVIIFVKKYPLCYLASFPVLDSTGYWRVIYILSGCLIPTLIGVGFKDIKKRMGNIWQFIYR